VKEKEADSVGIEVRIPAPSSQTLSTLTVEAVIFDLDGLLVDSEPLAAEVWRRAVAAYGATISDAEVSAMLGKRIVDDAEALITAHHLPATVESLVSTRNVILRALLPDVLRTMPGAIELARGLRARGIPLALATSGQRWYAEACLAVVGLSDVFPIRVTAEDVTRGKPDPEVYLTAAARLGLAPGLCLALEDAPLGAAAAIAARARVIAVPNAQTRGLTFPLDAIRATSLLEVAAWMSLGPR
jgi:HAD superfamily hydrolase (TIGR01509 family)